ncbi:unnamed protein product [Pylaiella littoralis]
MTTKVGPPCWADGLACPSLDGLDAAVQQARELVSRSAASVAQAGGRGGAVSTELVDQVFALVQLALDDRHPPPPATDEDDLVTNNSPEADKAFRSALAPGALGLVPKLAAALQPRQGNIHGGGSGLGLDNSPHREEQRGGPGGGRGRPRGAVVLAAGHLTAMEELVSRQNNTPALLMAHNGLAKLLKNNWPWLLGGVVDAPRLLSRLCEIYRDGLDQLKVALAQAEAVNAASMAAPSKEGSGKAPLGGRGGGGTGEVAHLQKFGKLLATFGTRMACLLRHLGPECPPRERREAYRLYAKAAAGVYPGLLASLRVKNGVDYAGAAGAAGVGFPGGVAGGIIYPKAVEAFLSTTDRPPCCQSADVCRDGGGASAAAATEVEANSAGGNGCAAGVSATRAAAGATAAATTARMAAGTGSCRCYEQTTGAFAGRKHDPWEALDALRPANRLPLPWTDPNRGRNSKSHGENASGAGGIPAGGTGGADNCGSDADGGEGPKVSSSAAAVDPLGAVLLLCEVLRREGWVSAAAAVAAPRLRRECCGWMLDHLAALFPNWVEVESFSAGDPGAAADVRNSEHGVAAALCDEVAAALGLFVSRQALNGEFQEAQVQLIEGCACHPHPVCREVWIGALKVFLGSCDTAAQEACVQSVTDAALDPRLSRRCRRRLGRALVAVCAATTADTSTTTTTTTATTDSSATALLLVPRARASLLRSCLRRLRDGKDGSSSSSGGGGGGGRLENGSGRRENSSGRSVAWGGAACALDLLRSLPPWQPPFSETGGGDGEALAAAAVSFATMAATAKMRNELGGGEVGEGGSSGGMMVSSNGGGGGGGTVNFRQIEGESFAAAARFLAVRSTPVAEPESEETARGRGHGQVFAGIDEAAREVGEKLGSMLAAAAAGLSAGLSEHALSAIARLLAKTNPSRLPRLCALIVEEAEKGRVGGEALLALAEALSDRPRRWVRRALRLSLVARHNRSAANSRGRGQVCRSGNHRAPASTTSQQPPGRFPEPRRETHGVLRRGETARARGHSRARCGRNARLDRGSGGSVGGEECERFCGANASGRFEGGKQSERLGRLAREHRYGGSTAERAGGGWRLSYTAKGWGAVIFDDERISRVSYYWPSGRSRFQSRCGSQLRGCSIKGVKSMFLQPQTVYCSSGKYLHTVVQARSFRTMSGICFFVRSFGTKHEVVAVQSEIFAIIGPKFAPSHPERTAIVSPFTRPVLLRISASKTPTTSCRGSTSLVCQHQETPGTLCALFRASCPFDFCVMPHEL